MRKLLGASFLLITGISFLFSSELLNDLYQRNDSVHLNLLRNSVLFDQQNDQYEINILENYYIGNYSLFVKDFNEKYLNIKEADDQTLFFYLVSPWHQ